MDTNIDSIIDLKINIDSKDNEIDLKYIFEKRLDKNRNINKKSELEQKKNL